MIHFTIEVRYWSIYHFYIKQDFNIMVKKSGNQEKFSPEGEKFLVGPGVLSIFLGVMVLVGWHTQTTWLIQIHPSFVPMQYNTAIGFLLSGLGFVFIAINKKIALKIIGLLLIFLSLMTLFQYISGYSLGIDQFFMDHYITTQTSHPGRMAPNTALCFFFTGVVIFLHSLMFLKNKSEYIYWFFSVLVLILSIVACIGYLTEVEPAYGWHGLTRMALHTSVGFIILSAGYIGSLCFSGHKFLQESWLPIPISMAIFLVFLLFGQALEQKEFKNIQEISQMQSEMITNQVENLLKEAKGKEKLTETFEVEELLKKMNLGPSSSSFYIEILENKNSIYKNIPHDISSLPYAIYSDLSKIGPDWSFRIAPSEKIVKKIASFFPELTIIFGLLISLSLGIGIFLFRKLEHHKNKAQESEKRYDLAIKGVGVGIWDWDVKTDKEVWSEKFYDLLGYEYLEIPATLENFSKSLHPDDKERTFDMVKEHFAKKSHFDIEYRLETKSGDYRWFRGTGMASYDESGNPVRMVGSIEDIHERILAEKELKRSNEDLEQFAYIASHDLREPLRGMRNFSQFLIEDYSEKLDTDGKHYLETIKKLGGRLENYLDSLLQFSRLGREKMSYKEVDLSDIIDEIKDAHYNVDDNKIEILLEKDIPNVFCDPVKISQIMRNLIENAIRYNLNNKKVIEITYKKNSENLHQFWIKDNGIGIKKDHWQRIFTIFKRLHPKDEFEGGTGLGLTLVKKAVERHGGEVWVESSQENVGTIFTFTIKEKKIEIT